MDEAFADFMSDFFDGSGFSYLKGTFVGSAHGEMDMEVFVNIGGMHNHRISYRTPSGNDSYTHGSRMEDLRKIDMVTSPSYYDLPAAVNRLFDSNLLKKRTSPDGSGDTVYRLSDRGLALYRAVYGHVQKICPVSKN